MISFVKCSAEPIETLYTIMGDYTYDITPVLKNNINWSLIFSLIVSYRVTYNERTMRMVKSHLISKAVEKYSNGKLIFVDETGYDFDMPEQNLKIEMKSGLKLFQPYAGTTVDIKISNTNGTSSDGKEHKKTFDYLLLIEPGLVGVISYERLKPFIRSVGDGFSAKIDTSEIELFSRISNYKVTDINLSNLFDKMIENSLQEIGDYCNA
jgi:hypothetical protein